MASGGFLGLGLTQSRYKFNYLPEQLTDFSFSIAAEEGGFIFSILLLLLFLVFIYKGFKIAAGAPDVYGFALASGITFWLGFQALLNISVALGLVPTTGLPLTFISHGGSSLVTTLFACGILVNISRFRKEPT
ncbi:FtsW/RodA/SpoVE family cell cycle protein [Candidatus Margulisiibacteriota bacterium]